MAFSQPVLLILALQHILFHITVSEGHCILCSIERNIYFLNNVEHGVAKVKGHTCCMVCIVLTPCDRSHFELVYSNWLGVVILLCVLGGLRGAMHVCIVSMIYAVTWTFISGLMSRADPANAITWKHFSGPVSRDPGWPGCHVIAKLTFVAFKGLFKRTIHALYNTRLCMIDIV